MNAWQTELMEEEARNQQWEEINAPDPNKGRMDKAGKSLKEAINKLSDALDWVYQAADDVNGLPIADEIGSLEETISDIGFSLKSIKNKLQYGWR